MNIRDQRAAAIRARISHGLAYDLGHWLPLLLDDLDAIDQEHNLSELPRTVAEAAEWARPAQPGTGSQPPPGPVPPVPVSTQPPKALPAARPATARRPASRRPKETA